MNIIVCIDDKQGMLFNKRRQSRDRRVVEDIVQMTDVLWMHPISEKLFEDTEKELKVSENFLQSANEGEYCFVENQHLREIVEQVEHLIVYRWNRNYPADFWLDIELNDWQLQTQVEFVGSSHEKITKEIYVRGK